MTRAALAAVSLLTIIPLRSTSSAPPREGTLAFFPLVGLLVGGATAVLDALLGSVLPITVVSAFDLAALALISGGLHLDGLADTADGFAAGPASAQRLAAMRDSRVGALGASALVPVLLVQWSALSSVATGRAAIIVSAAILARWAMVAAIAAHPPARQDGLGVVASRSARMRDVIFASIAAALIVGILVPAPAAALALALGTAALVGGAATRAFGGLTGDVYGAIGELVVALELTLGARTT